ncbi:MAG: single-stranded DNA-binding protein [Deltaproteobacteria bacterium]|nr:MAG: single-stranded DNA-binding protein [Deltaproteobacteria bacterium]RLC23315.1 MAG: single-stranded DNA-binding protein [Deltaproteobacteria bacterium]
MAGLNKAMLIGNLGKDPEIRYSQQGLAIVKFSIATSEQWTDKNTGDRQEKTEWHNIVAFGKQAEILEKYLSKGSKIFVEGRIQTSTYEKDGQTRYFTEIVVANFQFLGGKQDNQGGGGYQGGGGSGYQQPNSGSDNQFQSQTNPGMSGGQEPIPDDDIPF